MMKPLQDRVAIVTGAGAGIGFGIAGELARRGARIVIAEIDDTLGAQASAALQASHYDALYVRTDVTVPADVEQMAQAALTRYGQIDILVNNVGVVYRKPFEQQTAEDWTTILDINLTSVIYCVRACTPSLRASDHAAIVNLTSVNATSTMPGLGAYPAAKAGVIGLTRSLALDLAPRIRVNAVAPGVIRTAAWNALPDPEAALRDRLRYIPRKRVGLPEDVGKAVAFLVSDDADFITGAVLTVDGGMSSQMYADSGDER
ncbi:MAG: SDR family oxidoreductase [Chloroflexi bacterium]|nr:SDR family oxidoreductase [Chloroflexota bacterium]